MEDNYSPTIFISYKSENANIVRIIVDNLITNDIEVWFAEYKVLSINYSKFDETLKNEIDNAIEKSSHAIIFSNNLYEKSEYCNHEKQKILKLIPPENIIQVCTPKENHPIPDIQNIKEIPTISYNGKNQEEIQTFIVRKIFRNANLYLKQNVLSPLGKPNFYQFRYGKLNIGDLIPMEPNKKLGIVGQNHEFRFKGKLDSTDVNFEINIDPYNSSLKDENLELIQRNEKDDRKVYKQLIDRAKGWYGNDDSMNEFGLHLFWHNKNTHIGLTYFSEIPNYGISWTRIYSIIFEDILANRIMTVSFEFKGFFTTKNKLRSFKKFCQFQNYFYYMIDSYTYHSDECLKLLKPKSRFSILEGIRQYKYIMCLLQHN